MRGREKILICLVVVIIISGSLGIWLSTRDKLPDAIRIASGPNGGEYYKFGEALEKKLSVRTKKTVKNRETDGTLENLRLLKEGVVEVALLQSIVFPDPNDKESNNITVIAPLFLEPLIVFADKKSGIESVYDLENRRVCTGPVKSGIAKASDTLLEFYGLKKVKKINELFHKNSIHENSKNCDAGIMVMGLNGPCLKEIGKTDVRVLELPYVQALAESEAFLSGFTLPEGVFARPPLTTLPHKNIQTIAYTALLAVRKDASPALVNEILDSIYNTNIQMNFPDLLPVKEVREWSKIPFNPTAREFYNPLRRMEVFATR
ncbi:MAG: TAXI family TRAP transporter solute-binding subunit, partial [Candidatus Electrothrix sp. AS4_5]|nr:TAXI family TRAP transporter solute-binding subunit [Candidatus Electrothrix gigas]